jgi:parvulin-like peptidyl-prolyl isomerase
MRYLNVLLTLAVILVVSPARLTAQQPAQEQATPPKTVKVAAVVNGENIPESEVTSAMTRQLRGRTLTPERDKEFRQKMLDAMIDSRLVEQFLASKKIQADPKAVDAVIEDLKKRVAGDGLAFEEALKRQGLSEQTLRQRITGELSFQKYVDTAVTDREVQDYFNAHKEDLDGTEVRASHILIKCAGDAGDAQRQAALAKIKAIRQEIDKGLDFAEAAKKYSDCPSKEKGGDLDFFPRRNQMVEPFAAAAFGLEKGAVSEPVQSDFGWHLIKVTDRKQGEKGLNDVRSEIKDVFARGLWEKTAAQQRKLAKIEIPK